jgi:transglutaminase superfamily protein
MKRVHKFLRLSSADRRHLVSAALILGVIRLGLSLLPFQILRRLLRKVVPVPGQLHEAHRAAPGRTTWAVTVASQYIPKATCLTQALATQVLLARQGYATSLYIGVTKSDRGRLEAHAWIESQGKVVVGESALGRYIRLPALAQTGERTR